jgi:putative oxidoreductase
MTQQNEFLAFLARLCLVLIFPFSALNKIFDYQAGMEQAAHGWIPLPASLAALLLVLGGMLEVIGPICILLNFYRRQAALLFIFYVVATAVLFHNFWSFPFNGDAWNQNFWPFVKNVGLAGGFLYIATDARMQSLRDAFSLKPW